MGTTSQRQTVKSDAFRLEVGCRKCQRNFLFERVGVARLPDMRVAAAAILAMLAGAADAFWRVDPEDPLPGPVVFAPYADGFVGRASDAATSRPDSLNPGASGGPTQPNFFEPVYQRRACRASTEESGIARCSHRRPTAARAPPRRCTEQRRART